MNTNYKLPQLKDAAIANNLRNTYTQVFNYKLINKEHKTLKSYHGTLSDWDMEEICVLATNRTIVYTVTNRKRNITVNLALDANGILTMSVPEIAMLFDYIYATPQLPPRYSLIRNSFREFINPETMQKNDYIPVDTVTLVANKLRKSTALEICSWINTDVRPVLEECSTKNFFL